jgi:hypothetical protein
VASPAPSAPSAPSMSHSSPPTYTPPATYIPPTSPSSTSAPVMRSAPVSGAPRTSTASPVPSNWNAGKTATSVPAPESGSGRIVPEQKISGDQGRIIPEPRIGEKLPAKEHDPRTSEADLRHKVCLNEPCKEKDEPKPADPDLRRRACLDGKCEKCPPGESLGKSGVCASTQTNTASNQCSAGEVWNGGACVTNQCAAGTIWNGSSCQTNTALCAPYAARAGTLDAELRTARSQRDIECQQDPNGQECTRLRMDYEGLLTQYRMLQNEAPLACRNSIEDPIAF